jgi:hypothetical protein
MVIEKLTTSGAPCATILATMRNISLVRDILKWQAAG